MAGSMARACAADLDQDAALAALVLAGLLAYAAVLQVTGALDLAKLRRLARRGPPRRA